MAYRANALGSGQHVNPSSRHCRVRRSSTTDSLKMNPRAVPKITSEPARLPRIGSFLRQRTVATAAARGSGAEHISAIQGQLSPFNIWLDLVQYTRPLFAPSTRQGGRP